MVTDTYGTARDHWLAEGRTSIGRHAGNDIVILDDKAVSGRHAVIHVSADGLEIEIEDYDSTNGTWVNGQRVAKRQALGDGDAIGVGYHVLKFHAGVLAFAATRPAPLPSGFAVIDGPGAGARVVLDRALTRVGRPGAQVAAVTARHDGHYIAQVIGIEPIGGRARPAPPTLNGVPFGTVAVRLTPGDTVVIAGITLVFERPLRPENAAAPTRESSDRPD